MAEGGRLKVVAPTGALDARLREQLAAFKDLITDYLRERDATAMVHDAMRLQTPTGERQPLTPWQNSFWLMHQRDDADLGTLHAAVIMKAGGALDLDRLDAALAALADRQEVLKLNVAARSDGAGEQWIGSHAPHLARHRIDDGANETALQGAARAVAADLTRRTFDLGDEAPFRFAIISAGDERHRLMIVGHHIAVDGWSVGVLLRELFELYERADQPQLGFSYLHYAAELGRACERNGVLL